MKRLEPKDHHLYKSISDCQLFNQGQNLLYRVTRMDYESNGNLSDLYIYDFQSTITKRLTTDGNASSYFFLDDSQILIARKEVGGTTLKKIDLITGEESLYFTLPYKIEKIKQVDGLHFAFTVLHDTLLERDDLSKATYQDGTPKSTVYNDFFYFDEMQYRTNDEGIINGIKTHLYLYSLDSQEIIRISDSQQSVSTFDTQRDQVVYTLRDDSNPDYTTHSLHKYSLCANETLEVPSSQNQLLITRGRYDISSVYVVESGLYLIGHDIQATHNREKPQLYCYQDEEVYLISTGDMDINKSGATDIRFTSGPEVKKRANQLILTLCSDGAERLVAVNLQGNIEFLSEEWDGISGFDIGFNKTVLVLLSDLQLTEIYELMANESPKQLTNHNGHILQNFALSGIEEFTYSSHGDSIKGYVIKPINLEEGKKYPGVLWMHGGPRGLFSKLYQHKMQVLANRGYFCFYTNPHGSASRGNTFSSIFGQFGDMDYDDLMTFTDEVIKRYPDLDESRLGLTGHSYGGIMTNVIIGKTHRFKAAVASASLANYTTKAYLTDNGLGAGMLIYGDPMKDAWCWENSPIRRADQIKTPTLLLHGEVDYRCTAVEALQMFSALKRYGVDTEVYIFKGEAHGIKKPRNKAMWLEALCAWFDKYLS